MRTSDAPSPTPELRALIDRQQIHDALMRYVRGADRCDAGLMASVYHPDASDHHGSFRGAAHEFVRQYTQSIRDSATFVMHHVGNLLVELDGDRATSEAYFVVYLGGVGDEGPTINVMGGRYLDLWERRDGRWGIVDRVVIHDWSRSDTVAEHAFPRPVEQYAQGGWLPADPVYQSRETGYQS